MRKIRNIVFIMVIALVIVSMVGCSAAEPGQDAAASGAAGAESEAAAGGEKLTVAFVPKSTGAPYFIACEKGAKKAAEDLGIDYIWTGTPGEDSAKQIALIEDVITQDVDALVISPVDSQACVEVINKAMDAGIPTFTWDIDSPDSKRLFCITAGDAVQSGKVLAEGCAKEIGGEGQVAILTGALGSDAMTRRIEAVKDTFAKEYPDIEVVTVESHNEDLEKGISISENILQTYPDLKGFIGVSANCANMITTAVKSAGREGIAIWSQGLPSLNYDEVMDGTIKGLVLWNPGAMTYIAMAAAKQYIEDGTLPQNGQDYGEYAGAIVVNGDETIAYVPDLMFTPENIDQYKDI